MLYKKFIAYIERLMAAPPAIFEKVLFLLHANGSDGDTTTTKDYSTMNHTIKLVGGTLQGPDDPWNSPDAHSIKLNGADGAILVDTLAFNPVADNWTFECFLYPTQTYSFSLFRSYNENYNIMFYNGYIYITFNGDNTAIAPYTIVTNTWVHVAVVSSGATAKLYINGVQIGTKTSTAQSALITGYVIGKSLGYGYPFHGYMSNIRFTQSVVYSSNFTVPTQNLTALPDTKLLLLFDKYQMLFNSSNFAFVPNNIYGSPMLRSGGVFGTTGISLDGLSGVEFVPVAAGDMAVGTGDYTIEGYIKSSHTTTPALAYVFSIKSNGYPNKIAFYWNQSKGTMVIDAGDGTEHSIDGVNLNTFNQMTHFAVVRRSGRIDVFIGGIIKKTITLNIDLSTTYHLNLGCAYSGIHCWTGMIDEFRITKGQAVYQVNFEPPMQEFPNS